MATNDLIITTDRKQGSPGLHHSYVDQGSSLFNLKACQKLNTKLSKLALATCIVSELVCAFIIFVPKT